MKNKTSIKKTKTIKNKFILLIIHRTNERSRDCLLFCMYLYYRKNIKKINIQTFEPQKTTNKTNILINFFFEHATYSKTCKFASPLCHLVCAAAVALILMF